MNLKDLGSTLWIEDDTGQSTALSTTTLESLVSALRTAGFVAWQVAPENTSPAYLVVRYQETTPKNKPNRSHSQQTGQTSGWRWSLWNPVSREWEWTYSTDLDGDDSLVDLESLREYSYHTLTSSGTECRTSRCDTNPPLSEDSAFREDVPRLHGAWNL